MSTRFYEPVAVAGDNFAGTNRNYAARGRGGHCGRTFGAELKLSRDDADLLCDILEEVRQHALQEGTES